jgi:alcohol dehydrogenase
VVASAGTAETLGLALKTVAPLGIISVVGLSGGQLSEIDADDLSEKEVTVIGSHSSPGVWDDLLACAAAGRYDLKSLVSHTLPLDEASQAFRLLDTPGEPVHKVLLQMVD